MKGIVITTHEKTKPFFLDLMNSLTNCKYPIVVITNTDENNEFELAGLKAGMQLFDEFIYLHDTVQIKDMQLFDILFSYQSMVSISPNFLMFLGKYNSEQLKTEQMPIVTNKHQAVDLETWLRFHLVPKYGIPHLDRNFVDNNNFEFKHNRNNMILENQYLKKYKGTWDRSMIQ